VVTEWKNISSGVPQGNLLYTADVPNDDNTTIVMFADNKAILLTLKNMLTATDNL